MQIKRLTGPTWGLTPKATKKLYISVTIPQIMYGMDMWCTPLHGWNTAVSRKESVNPIKKLTTVQRAGAIAITGGFRTTPTDSLDAHVALIPMDLCVDKFCYNAITCLATLPPERPLHAPVKKRAAIFVKRHCLLLHTLTQIYGIKPSEVEKIPAVRNHPKSTSSPPVCIDIPPNKEASKRADTSATEHIKVYSDGSAHDSQVGATAILRRNSNPDRVLRLHLGTLDQHTVYEAELVGMILGLHLIKTERKNKVKCVLNVNNQVALAAIKTRMTKSGQHFAANILKQAKQLKKMGGNGRYGLTFRWSAGHVGIEGNEEADKEAKAVADRHSSDKKELPIYLRGQLSHIISAMQQAHFESLKRHWVEKWASSPRYQRLRFLDLLTPYSQKYMKYISNPDISRKTAS